MSTAQAKVADRKTLVSDLIKSEFWLQDGYERAERSLTVLGTEEIGAVFASDGTQIQQADIAGLTGSDDLSILVDDCIYTRGDGAGTFSYAVATGGVGASGGLVVTRQQLKFLDTLSSGEINTVVVSLNAQGIKVVSQY